MASFLKFDDFVEQLGLASHNLNTDQLNVALALTAPVDANTSFADITEIAAGNGYTAGGDDTTNIWDESPAGTGRLRCTNVVFTATGGAIAQFRYVVFYNTSGASAGLDLLIGRWDHGSPVDLNAGDTFTVNFGATTITIT